MGALGQRHHVHLTEMRGLSIADPWDTVARVEELQRLVNYVVRGGGEPCRSGFGRVVLFWPDCFSPSTFSSSAGIRLRSWKRSPWWLWVLSDAAQGGAAVALTNDNIWAKMDIQVGTRMRRAAVADGILSGSRSYRFRHRRRREPRRWSSSVFSSFLNPGTATYHECTERLLTVSFALVQHQCFVRVCGFRLGEFLHFLLSVRQQRGSF